MIDCWNCKHLQSAEWNEYAYETTMWCDLGDVFEEECKYYEKGD